ncbi:MAG: fatty acid desaturase [Nevskia sp.]|nr:fatty acid desaturase [Nevskia sp.]
MPAVAAIRQQKRSIIDRHAKPDNFKGATQVLTTLLPVAALWYAAALGDRLADADGLTAAATLVLSLFLLRVFVLMHDCGHGSLFRTSSLNKALGFGFGLLSGMPQYVWAQHHNYHHATNGNWEKYRGPLSILSVDEYDALSRPRQRSYVRRRNIFLAPFGGFLYLIFNPRVTWLKGTAGLARHVLRGKIAQPGVSVRTHAARYETRHWKTGAEFWHMTMNNLVLLSAWALMCWLVGPVLFFCVYLASASLAGGAGIVLFAVQHNFEHSYASGDLGWDCDSATLHGTSYLALPGWLNWLTANIGYHHIHHLSPRIPNYRLAGCHAEHGHLFGKVKRLTLGDIGASLKFLLWDPRLRQIISVAEHESARLAAAA